MFLNRQKIIKNKIINKKQNISNDQNINKISIIDFDVDLSEYSSNRGEFGSSKIKIRKDILEKLKSIKNILNNYGIPLTCDLVTPNLNNSDLSVFAQTGLEIRINFYSALNPSNILENNDFFVDNYSSLRDDKLRIYGNCRKKYLFSIDTYQPVKKIYNVYGIVKEDKNFFLKKVKIYKTLLDITKIFEDFGFRHLPPDPNFFKENNVKKSNWNIFQYIPSTLIVGSTEKDLLKTVYYESDNNIWLGPEKYWDGEKFNE